MRTGLILTGILLLLATLAVGGLAWVQNVQRMSQLSLDLGVAAWELREPVPVLGLMAGSFLAGALTSVLVLLPMQLRRRSRRSTAPDVPDGRGAY